MTGRALLLCQHDRLSRITGSSRGGSGSSLSLPSRRARKVWCASLRVGPRSSPRRGRACVLVERYEAGVVRLARRECGARRCAYVPSISGAWSVKEGRGVAGGEWAQLFSTERTPALAPPRSPFRAPQLLRVHFVHPTPWRHCYGVLHGLCCPASASGMAPDRCTASTASARRFPRSSSNGRRPMPSARSPT
jgi:hypothetical protein